jgi:hypothetical protein
MHNPSRRWQVRHYYKVGIYISGAVLRASACYLWSVTYKMSTLCVLVSWYI